MPDFINKEFLQELKDTIYEWRKNSIYLKEDNRGSNNG